MGLKADVRYDGEVLRGEWVTSSNTGTRGLQLDLQCEDGEITHVIYVTPKSLEMAARQFKVLGATDEQLLDPQYMEYEFPVAVVGAKVRFKTFEDNYRNVSRVKVESIFPITPDNGIGSGVADLFRSAKGMAPAAPKLTAKKPEVSDDDIPF